MSVAIGYNRGGFVNRLGQRSVETMIYTKVTNCRVYWI